MLLVDQSEARSSLSDDLPAVARRAEYIADATNSLLKELVIRCCKGRVQYYFDVGVIRYGEAVGPAFTGPLAQRDFIPINEVAEHPARIEDRTKKEDDGAGGLVEVKTRFAIWFDPVAHGDRPMCGALSYARNILVDWVQNHPDSFPPMVFNIVGGEPTDGDPIGPTQELMNLKTRDGNVLVLNCYVNPSVPWVSLFPSSDQELGDAFARRLFRMSSILPSEFVEEMRRLEYAISYGARAFAINSSLLEVIDFLGGDRAPRWHYL